jgi:hypothetical protein
VRPAVDAAAASATSDDAANVVTDGVCALCSRRRVSRTTARFAGPAGFAGMSTAPTCVAARDKNTLCKYTSLSLAFVSLSRAFVNVQREREHARLHCACECIRTHMHYTCREREHARMHYTCDSIRIHVHYARKYTFISQHVHIRSYIMYQYICVQS